MDPQASNQVLRRAPWTLQPLHRGTRLLRSSVGLPCARRPRLDVWDTLDRLFVAMIVDRYEADIAFSFAHSLRRNIDHGLWKPVAYSFPPPSKRRAYSMAAVHRRLPVNGRIDIDLILTALQRVHLAVPFRDLQGMPADSRAGHELFIRARVARLRRGPPPRRPRHCVGPGSCAGFAVAPGWLAPGPALRPPRLLPRPPSRWISSKPDSSATAPPSWSAAG